MVEVQFNRCIRAHHTKAASAIVIGSNLLLSALTAAPAMAQVKIDDEVTGWFANVWSTIGGGDDAQSQGVYRFGATDENEGKEEVKTETTGEIKETGGNSTQGEDLFRPGPEYDDSYDFKDQIDVYGAKTAVDPPRPPIEIGRQQYTSGNYDQSSTILGALNPLLPGLAVYGDWRTAVAFNSNNGNEIPQIATRLNIDVDLKLTGTERIHAFFTPFQDGAKFTRFEFDSADGDGLFSDEYDFNAQTLYFEGDAGSLYSGFTGKEASFDLPFTVGLFPLFLQNGIWANDAILGGAFTIPARNSAALGLSNFDITFFGAFDDVTNAGILGGDNDEANILGVTAFLDAFDGYVETGYGVIQNKNGADDGELTHFLTAAYSRRYRSLLSNTTRIFANFGDGDQDDGAALIVENSIISGLPSTLLPYGNFFVGIDNPQSLVDGNGAGILKGVGINFETDALTGFPKLNDSGSNAFGGAIGLQYLFNLDQQIVFELATVQPFGNTIAGVGAESAQYAAGARYQIPINSAWLFRADATYQLIEDAEDDNFGLRAEVRRKF